MIESPRGILATSIGTINFAMTEAAHVFLHTESRNNEAVTIRGIPYHISCHLHLINGEWQNTDYHDPYMSRKDVFNKEASQPARKTAREALAKAWTSYLADHPSLARKAEQAKAADEVGQLTSELADLENKAAEKRAALKAAKKRQASI